MALSILLLAVLLILLGLNWLTWVSISLTVLGIIALVDGILFLLEGLGAFNYTIPARRREA